MNDSGRPDPGALPMPDLRSTFPGPFPASPHAEQAEQQLLGWLGEFPLLPPSDALRALCNITGHGVARTLPAADREGLVLCAQLFVWLTAFDDVHGEAAAAHDPAPLVSRGGELMRVLSDDGTPVPENAFAQALADLLPRFRQLATPTEYLRLTGHLRDNLLGIVWEAHHFAAPDRISVAEYCAMRPYTVFVRTIMAAAETVLPYRLTEEERSSGPVKELETAVSDLAGWINDLASYAREAGRDRSAPLSLPTLLMRQKSCDLAEAFALTSRMCEEQAAVARSRITELTGSGEGALVDHARAVEAVANSFVWHIDHTRYRS